MLMNKTTRKLALVRPFARWCANMQPPNLKQPEVNEPEVWRVLKGFSMFSSRRDVEKLLHDSGVSAKTLDAQLNQQGYLSGNWAVQFSKKEDVTSLQTSLETKRKESSGSPSISLIALLGNRSEYASAKGITNRTLHIKDIPSDVTIEQLVYFFEDFGVRKSDIDMKILQSKFHYLVTFKSPELAQRCLLERNTSYIGNRQVHMIWYDI